MIKARERGVAKVRFVVDLGEIPLNQNLRNRLMNYNANNPTNQIAELWVVHRYRLEPGDTVEIGEAPIPAFSFRLL